jgi:hypothetical protein
LATPVTNLIQAAPGTSFQWAVTAWKVGMFSTGAAAYATTVDLCNINGAPGTANVKWFTAIELPASVNQVNDSIVFPSDDPVLFGANNPVAVFLDTALVAGIFVLTQVKGYLVAI